jgi:hypothetical protein
MSKPKPIEVILYNYLSTASSMRYGATEGQLRAAAKNIARSGRLPAPVAEVLRNGVREAEA